MTLRERLSWHALGGAVVDPRVDRAVMARVAIYMYLGGALLGVVSLLAGQVQDGRVGPAVGGVVGAVAVASVVLVLFDRLSLRAFQFLAAVARVGGDEFMILVPESTVTAARALARRLDAAVDEAFGEEPLGVTVSFGVATYPEDGANLDDLYHASDEALYRAKGQGELSMRSSAP